MIEAPLIVGCLSALYYMEYHELFLVLVWCIFTSRFVYYPIPLIATILLAVFWNLVILAVFIITTFLPQYERKGFLILSVVGACIPNLFAHPLHIHPIRLLIRIGITAILPRKYIWYVCAPEYFLGIVIWRMLRHHYPKPPPTPPPPPVLDV
jgi:hypothetical protein